MLAASALQFGPLSIGWPFLMPFSFDDRRSLSISSLLVLTVAGGLSMYLLPRTYAERYHLIDQGLLYFLTIMAFNGVLFRSWLFIRDNVELPQLIDRSDSEDLDPFA